MTTEQQRENLEIVQKNIKEYRKKLLDISNRNNLVSFNFRPRSNRQIRIIDEILETIFDKIKEGKKLIFKSLPPEKDELEDENSDAFLNHYEAAKNSNENYLKKIADLGEEFDESNLESRKIIRELKDIVRKELNLPERPAVKIMGIEEYARAHNIEPKYELESITEEETEKHSDDYLQTLFMPEDMNRKLRLLKREARRSIEEKGTNTLFLTFGFLEWYEAKTSQIKRLSPLIILPITLDEEKTKKGVEYSIVGTESEPITNLSLRQRLANDFGIELPEIDEETTPEKYFKSVEDSLLKEKSNWKIRRFLSVAILNYSKMAMYEDLDPKKWKENGTVLGSQKTIMELFTGRDKEDSLGKNYDVDDKKNYKQVPILVDEADSSQFSAILDAVNNKNLAIQGPPGTGKSTTITNLIAVNLFLGKKVLFVAEKKNALNVVYDNLARQGLKPFLFRLVSTNTKKTEIIEDLDKRINLDTPIGVQNLKLLEKKLFKLREEIREYGKLLTMQVDDNKVFDVFGAVAKSKLCLENFPSALIDNYLDEQVLAKLPKEKIQEIENQLFSVEELYQSIVGKFKKLENHPWYGLILDDANPFEVKELIKKLNDLEKIIEQINQKRIAVQEIIGEKIMFEDNDIKNKINIFLDINAVEDNDTIAILEKFTNYNYVNSFRDFFSILRNYTDFLNAEKELFEYIEFEEKFEVVKLKRHFKNIQNSHFFSFFIDSEYRKSRKYFTYMVKDGKYKKKRAIGLINKLIYYLENKSNQAKNKSKIKEYKIIKNIIGSHYKGIKTNIDTLVPVSEYLKSLEHLDQIQQIRVCKNIKKLKMLQTLSQELDRKIIENSKEIDMLTDKLDSKKFFNIQNKNYNYLTIKKKIQTCNLEDKESLNQWIQLNNLSNNLSKLPKYILNLYKSEKIVVKNLSESWNYYVYNSFLKQIFKANKNLSKYIEAPIKEKIPEFRKLDKEITEGKKIQLIQNLLAMEIPEGISKGKTSNYTEKGLIDREIQKKKAYIPFRQLLKRAGNAMRAIKPCYMLSPVSLSQICEQKAGLFDVLIMDEASQMRIEDSLGSILRSKQCIIVGDPQQLPPTPFFMPDYGDIVEDEDIEDDESVLDLALSKYQPKRFLQWHYRSRHESLIQFSNFNFYNNKLIVTPSANPEFAIKHHFVQGTYNTKINEKEVEAIVKGIIEFMNEPKNLNKSCLVATMNISQRHLIDEAITNELRHNIVASEYVQYWETMDGNEFRVKNLENVQGDERDVIFISTLFGPNKDGVVMQRFGPINQKNGYRRLNVLFTRARERVELYTSLHPSDIKADAYAKGRTVLKNYIEYAKTKKLDTGTVSGRDFDSPFQDWVIDALKKLGYEAVPEVGVAGYFIDIGIKHPSYKYGYFAGIECDGRAYHSSLSARDNDIIRQKVLEGLGWNIYRIWSTDWYQDPNKELKILDNYLKLRLRKKLS